MYQERRRGLGVDVADGGVVQVFHRKLEWRPADVGLQDFTRWDDTGGSLVAVELIGRRVEGDDSFDGRVRILAGGEPTQVPRRYAETDPAVLVPTGIPAVLAHGDVDDLVPIALSRSYEKHARAAGDSPALVELPGTGHFELIDPLSAAWPTVMDSLELLLT